jgi:hypothetical protein
MVMHVERFSIIKIRQDLVWCCFLIRLCLEGDKEARETYKGPSMHTKGGSELLLQHGNGKRALLMYQAQHTTQCYKKQVCELLIQEESEWCMKLYQQPGQTGSPVRSGLWCIHYSSSSPWIKGRLRSHCSSTDCMPTHYTHIHNHTCP